jgi:hypothetical protein
VQPVGRVDDDPRRAARAQSAQELRVGLDGLVGHLGVLGPRGLPLETDGPPALPGLWFVGFVPTLGGQLREGSIAAGKVAAAVAAAEGAPAATRG